MTDQYYISNAGIVLLHPFLPTFAASINLTTGNGDFKDESCRIRLAYLLGHLATGNEQMEGTDRALSNILCGIAPDVATEYHMVLTSDEKEEAKNLLTAFTDHWNGLNDASIAAIRDSFILREGLIMTAKETVTLIIANSPLNILLGKIPSNISMIKTPWMSHILPVIWQ